MNEFFIYLDDITVRPGYLRGWRIFKMTAVALGPKNLSRTRIIRQYSLRLRRIIVKYIIGIFRSKQSKVAKVTSFFKAM